MSARALAPTRGEALAALASAVLFGFAFPPYALFVPVFVALVPVSVAVARAADVDAGWRTAARLGFWFGLVGYAINLYWLASALAIYSDLAFLGYIGALIVVTAVVLAAIVALYFARRATRLPLALLVPVVWVASEVALTYLSDLAFPWLPLGLAVTHTPVLAQIADLSGVHGVSFWIAATNGLIADAWMLRARRRALVARAVAVIGLFAVVAAYGAWRLRTTQIRAVAPVAIVQPNIPQQDKWQAENQGKIVGILAGLSRQRLADHDARLLLWPEAALPGFLSEHPSWSDTLHLLAAQYRTPIIFGVLDYNFPRPGDFEYYNAAMLVDSTGVIGRQPAYHKAYLVPVVERVPFINPHWFSALRFFGAFARGGPPVPYTLGFGKVGVLICFESIFPQRSRAYRREGVSVLVNITNDAWFGRSVAPYQHAAHLVLRAIENRVGIVRAANTGISESVDPLGRVHGATSLFVPATRTYPAETTDVRTLYVHLGDWVGALSLLLTAGALLFAGARRRR